MEFDHSDDELEAAGTKSDRVVSLHLVVVCVVYNDGGGVRRLHGGADRTMMKRLYELSGNL